MFSQHDTAAGTVAASARKGSVWVIELRGDLDLAFIDSVQYATADVLRRFEGPVVFDLRQLRFADSLLLGHLLDTVRRRPVGLVGASPLVQRMLKVTGTASVLPVFGDPKAAEAGLLPRTRSGGNS